MKNRFADDAVAAANTATSYHLSQGASGLYLEMASVEV